jgi:hypothetical protein
MDKIQSILTEGAVQAGISVQTLWALVRPLIVAAATRWLTQANIDAVVNAALARIDSWVNGTPAPEPTPTPAPVVGTMPPIDWEAAVSEACPCPGPCPKGEGGENVYGSIPWATLLKIAAAILTAIFL